MPHDPRFEALLADVVDHLVPEAFDRPTCAERVAREPVALIDLPPRAAATVFDRWVDDRLLESLERGAYTSPLTVVTTSDGQLLRRFVDCGCGELTCATQAARDELWSIEQPWLLAIDLVRPAPGWEVVVGPDGQQEEGMVAPDGLRWRAPWFADARGHWLAATRAGLLRFDGEVVLDSVRFAPREHPVSRRFHRLLFRHPSRRQFPLRGR